MHNYGLIIKRLRNLRGLSIKVAAAKIEKSAGWLSEIENNRGLARLTQGEFDRIVNVFNGNQYKKQFKTWVSVEKVKDKTNHLFDGAVLKHVRNSCELSLNDASGLVGLSRRYLSNLENGHKPVRTELRDKIMQAYGYAPSSFRNLAPHGARAKAVPIIYKIKILLHHLDEQKLHSVFEHLTNLNSKI